MSRIILLVYIIGPYLVVSATRQSFLDCQLVKDTFQHIPEVAKTIYSTAVHDPSLVLCQFSNHTESGRVSCCSQSSEEALVKNSKNEYQKILDEQTTSMLPKIINLRDHFYGLLSTSRHMTEYEIGGLLSLPHSVGREMIENFFSPLEQLLLNNNKTVNVYEAMDNLQDQLFLYAVREAFNPGNRVELESQYSDCLKANRRNLNPPPLSSKPGQLAVSLYYSSIAANFLMESLNLTKAILNATRDLTVTNHCYRDLAKLNHCQKCYGHVQLKPCKAFCEDIFMVCLKPVLNLERNWGYHMDIMKILSKYILEKVNIQVLFNSFATEMRTSVNYAIMEYANYKAQLEAVCGSPKTKKASAHRLKVWERPLRTSYDRDLSADLRSLYMVLENELKSYYSALPANICHKEAAMEGNCWDGLTDRVNKKRVILEFKDPFAPYPADSMLIKAKENEIIRIRKEVLKIFLPKTKQNTNKSGNDEGSGSGLGQSSDDEENDSEEDLVQVTTKATVSSQPHQKFTEKLQVTEAVHQEPDIVIHETTKMMKENVVTTPSVKTKPESIGSNGDIFSHCTVLLVLCVFLSVKAIV